MLRRIAILTLVGLSAFAGTALADTTWHAQVSDGLSTSARKASRCAFQAGASAGTLVVTCRSGGTAALIYAFTSDRAVVGMPCATLDADSTGAAAVGVKPTAVGTSLKVRVTVVGAGTVRVNSVSVGYYTK